MNYLRNGLFVVLSVFTLAIASAAFKSGITKYHSGWDGIADVLGALMVGAILGLVLSVFLLKKGNEKHIWYYVLSAVILLGVCLIYLKLRPKPRLVKSQYIKAEIVDNSDGLGILTIPFERNKTIYLYHVDHPTPVKTVFDSLVINAGADEITYAPPWFWPYKLKADYQILHLKAIGLYHHFVEVEVNSKTKRTALISMEDGDLKMWPQYFLEAASIRTINPQQKIHRRPLDYSDTLRLEGHELFVPAQITDTWIKVNIVDTEKLKLGEGWTQWRSGTGEILISADLLW